VAGPWFWIHYWPVDTLLESTGVRDETSNGMVSDLVGRKGLCPDDPVMPPFPPRAVRVSEIMSLLKLSYGRATGGQAMHNGTSLGFAVYQFSNQSPQHTFPLSVFHSNSSTHLDSTHVFAAPQFLIFQLSHFPTQHSPGYSPLSTSSPAGISVPMDFVRSPVLGCVLAHPTVSSLFCPNPYTPPLNSSQFQSNSASTSIPLEFLQFNSSRLCISQLCHLRPQHCPGAASCNFFPSKYL